MTFPRDLEEVTRIGREYLREWAESVPYWFSDIVLALTPHDVEWNEPVFLRLVVPMSLLTVALALILLVPVTGRYLRLRKMSTSEKIDSIPSWCLAGVTAVAFGLMMMVLTLGAAEPVGLSEKIDKTYTVACPVILLDTSISGNAPIREGMDFTVENSRLAQGATLAKSIIKDLFDDRGDLFYLGFFAGTIGHQVPWTRTPEVDMFPFLDDVRSFFRPQYVPWRETGSDILGAIQKVVPQYPKDKEVTCQRFIFILSDGEQYTDTSVLEITDDMTKGVFEEYKTLPTSLKPTIFYIVLGDPGFSTEVPVFTQGGEVDEEHPFAVNKATGRYELSRSSTKMFEKLRVLIGGGTIITLLEGQKVLSLDNIQMVEEQRAVLRQTKTIESTPLTHHFARAFILFFLLGVLLLSRQLPLAI